MARPQKEGLDYFSMDVEKDNKLKFLKAKFGVLGFGMYVELLQFIYKQGYYTTRDEDNVLLFMAETGLKEEEIELMLEFMVVKGLFNADLFKKYKILTSSGIQKRYAEGTKKRVKPSIDRHYWLVGEYDHLEFTENKPGFPSEETELMSEESTQSKGKEKKENTPEIINGELLEFIERRNNATIGTEKVFPKCMKVTDDLKKARNTITKQLTYDDLVQAANNYIIEIKGRRKDSDYAKHRFSLGEFLEQKNGARKFYNYQQ